MKTLPRRHKPAAARRRPRHTGLIITRLYVRSIDPKNPVVPMMHLAEFDVLYDGAAYTGTAEVHRQQVDVHVHAIPSPVVTDVTDAVRAHLHGVLVAS